MRRIDIRRSIISAAVTAAALFVAIPLLAEPSAPFHHALDVPVAIEIVADETAIIRGLVTEVQVIVRAEAPLRRVGVRTSGRGSLEIAQETSVDRGFLDSGETLSLTVPVRCLELGGSSLLVDVEATLAGKRFRFSKRAELNIYLREDRAFVSTEDMLYLERRALVGDRSGPQNQWGLARSGEMQLYRVETATDRSPRGLLPSTARSEALSVSPDWTGLARGSRVEDPLRIPQAPAATNITVFGTVRYLDENGVAHPVFGYGVEVRDDDTIGSDLLANLATATDGTYSATFDSDDPDGPDIFVRFRPRNSLIEVRPLGGGSYENDTAVTDDVPSNTVLQIDITFAATGNGPVGSVLSGMTWIAVYTRDFLNSGVGLAQIPVEFPGSTGAAFYNGSLINMRPNDRFDWDVMHHEYGHYVMDAFNFEDNPGGPHNIGQCLSVTRPSKNEGLRLAWGEAWPTFFGTTGQMLLGLGFTEAPRVGDAVYADTIDGFGGFSYGLDTNSNDLGAPGDLNGLGEDNELAIQRILYDLFDANGDSRDAVVRDHLDIFNVLRGSNVTTMSAAWGLIRGSALVSGNADDLDFGAITTDHAVGPQPLAPAAGTIVTSANANFSWTAAVQCSNTFAGDDFDLVFYDADTFAPILTIPGLTTTSTSLSQAQILTLTAASHDILWAVEGSNTASPATGPYLGDNLAIVVNTPPVADAGPDQPDVECTSSTTTPVQLDGTGSSDEDGDTLTYSWSAPGVVFDDSTSAMPTGQFPEGSTVATLTVSDGIQEDTDTVVITVVDTTPPEIVCPANITVECTQSGGTPASDPQLAPFFAGVSATDVCDPDPVITNNAPAFFNLGVTVVEFTATDDDGNASQCQATVTVVDTTPPDIQVALAPTVLWPPNHKMVDIAASVNVADICDPSPTFVLASIVSNEPDNAPGIGDGNTVNDIQEAAFGTPDTAFKLRAERAGTGTGRIYTVTYTAMDASGNQASASAVVVVPKRSP